MVKFAGRLLCTSLDQAKLHAESSGSPFCNAACYACVVELAGTDGRYCITVAVSKSLVIAIAELGAEESESQISR